MSAIGIRNAFVLALAAAGFAGALSLAKAGHGAEAPRNHGPGIGKHAAAQIAETAKRCDLYEDDCHLVPMQDAVESTVRVCEHVRLVCCEAAAGETCK